MNLLYTTATDDVIKEISSLWWEYISYNILKYICKWLFHSVFWILLVVSAKQAVEDFSHQSAYSLRYWIRNIGPNIMNLK